MTEKRTKNAPIAPRLLALEERDKRYAEEIASLKAQLEEAKAEIARLRQNGIRNVNTNSFM